jgi:hypothetical protein
MGHEDIRIAHLLLGILCEPASPAAAIAGRHGMSLERLRRDAGDRVAEEST